MTTLSKEDIVRMDSESGLYVYHNGDADIEQLQAFATIARADLVAENERLKSIPMKYRRMAFNAELQDENDQLRTALAELLTAINNYIPEADHCSDDGIKYYSELVSVLDKHRK